jgi:hypothetical protein
MDGIILTGEYRSTRRIKRTSVTLATTNPIRNVLIYKPQYTKSTSIFLPVHKQKMLSIVTWEINGRFWMNCSCLNLLSVRAKEKYTYGISMLCVCVCVWMPTSEPVHWFSHNFLRTLSHCSHIFNFLKSTITTPYLREILKPQRR